MNCSKGDIARFVKTEPECRVNLQRLVSVDAPCPNHRINSWHCTALQPLLCLDMLTGHYVEMPAGETGLCIGDEILRPLHDGDGMDEMTERAGKAPLVEVPNPVLDQVRERRRLREAAPPFPAEFWR